MEKKIVGRPIKVTDEVISKLEDALRRGATVSVACRYADISRDTYYRYLRSKKRFAMKMGKAKNMLHFVEWKGNLVI